MTWVASLLLLANAVLVPVGLFVLYPRYQRSVFRYELWTLRDDLWDGIVRGDFRDRASAELLLAEIERGIKYSDQLTLRRLIPLFLALGKSRNAILVESYRRARRETPTLSFDASLIAIYEAYRQAIANRLGRGSVLGLTLRLGIAGRVLYRNFRTSPEPSLERKLRAKKFREEIEAKIDGDYADVFSIIERRDPRDRSLVWCAG